jgi:hypothetical protein
VLVSGVQKKQAGRDGRSMSDHAQEVPHMTHNQEIVMLFGPKEGHGHFTLLLTDHSQTVYHISFNGK